MEEDREIRLRASEKPNKSTLSSFFWDQTTVFHCTVLLRLIYTDMCRDTAEPSVRTLGSYSSEVVHVFRELMDTD